MSRYMPLPAGGSRFWRALQRIRNWSLTVALGVSLLVGGVARPLVAGDGSARQARSRTRLLPGHRLPHRLARRCSTTSSTAAACARSAIPCRTSSRCSASACRSSSARCSSSTPTARSARPPSSIPTCCPSRHIDGLSLPAADPDLLGAAPTVGSADYTTQALAFVNVYVPDNWNGLPVNFQSTFLNTVTCADAFGTDPCDPSLLPAFALELWGLPTSLPTLDPLNTDFVYQRFQKGIMHYLARDRLDPGPVARRLAQAGDASASTCRPISAPTSASRAFTPSTRRRARWRWIDRATCRTRRWPRHSAPTRCRQPARRSWGRRSRPCRRTSPRRRPPWR